MNIDKHLQDEAPKGRNPFRAPAHYCGTNQEQDLIAFTQRNGVGFVVGNVFKYVLRAGKKKASCFTEDIAKATDYLQRHVRWYASLKNTYTQADLEGAEELIKFATMLSGAAQEFAEDARKAIDSGNEV